MRRIFFLKVLLVITIIFCVSSLTTAMLKLMEINKILKHRQIELTQIEQRRQSMDVELQKLDNIDYILQYIRDDYYYTAKDEIFFLILDDSNG